MVDDGAAHSPASCHVLEQVSVAPTKREQRDECLVVSAMLGVALERGERAHVVRLELEHFLPARKCARLVAQLIEEFSHLAQENPSVLPAHVSRLQAPSAST